MIRHCVGLDPNLIGSNGERGQCGRSFDDTRHSLECPHEELVTPILELDPTVIARYTLHADMTGVVIHCQYHGSPKGRQLSAFPHWAHVRGMPDALAWIDYHERVEQHPRPDALSPASGRSLLSVVGMLSRELHVAPETIEGALTRTGPAERVASVLNMPRAAARPTDEGAGMADVSRETSAADTAVMPRIIDGGEPDGGGPFEQGGWFGTDEQQPVAAGAER